MDAAPPTAGAVPVDAPPVPAAVVVVGAAAPAVGVDDGAPDAARVRKRQKIT